MSQAATRKPRIVHALPGRVRLHLPGGLGEAWPQIETRVRQVAGVHSVEANPRTENVLIHFDPTATTERTLLALLWSGERGASGPLSALPSAPGTRRPHPLVTTARCLGGCGALLAASSVPDRAVCLVGLLQNVPLTSTALARLLGAQVAEALAHLTALLAGVLGGQCLGLALAVVNPLGWLAG